MYQIMYIWIVSLTKFYHSLYKVHSLLGLDAKEEKGEKAAGARLLLIEMRRVVGTGAFATMYL